LPCEPTVGLGTVAGHLAADPEAVVVWVDAHADINTITRNTTALLI
jgi:arginase family enzyme